MKRFDWGTTANGEPVTMYELESDTIKLRVIDRGATIVDFIVKPLERNIVLGYDSLQGYEEGTAYLGASVGRVANRIAGARCEIDGTEYHWKPNNGPNLLHSGENSLSFDVWHLVPQSAKQAFNYDKITLATMLRSEEDGFPGDLRVQLDIIVNGADVNLTYRYMTSRNSVVNITGHSYFNLNGTDLASVTKNRNFAALQEAPEGSTTNEGPKEQPLITNHQLRLDAIRYMPFGENQIPTGHIASVERTPFDFSVWRTLGNNLNAYKEELAEYRGYDHQYVLRLPTTSKMFALPVNHRFSDREDMTKHLALCGTMHVADLALEVYSNAPGFQLYTGNWLDETGRDGVHYGPYSGMCIEPQFAPNDVNMPNFGESLTKAGTIYERHITYRVDLLNG